MFAEGDRLENFNVGFDLNFGDKWYYDAIRPISTGESVSNIQNTTDTEYTNADETQQVVRYTGNHDTSGDGTPLEVFGGRQGVMANFVVSAYMRGVPFLYGGQEVAFEERIPFPWDSVTIDWDQNEDVTAEFKKVLDFRTQSEAIRRGELSNFSNEDVVAFSKVASDEKVAVFANLRFTRDTFTIPAGLAGTYNDAYTGESVTLVEGEALPLEGFEYRALTTADVEGTPPGPVQPSVTVLPIAATLGQGETQQLEATVRPEGEVSWESSDTDVATVDANGLVTAVSGGTAIITASSAEASGSATIDVYTPREFTVHFYRPADWGEGINIYYWEAEPAGLIEQINWPGVAMTNDGGGWYSYTFNDIRTTNIIFNDEANQTGNLSRADEGWYYNDEWYDSEPDVGNPTDPVDPPTDPVDPPTDPVDPPTDPVDPPTDPSDPEGYYRIKNRWLDAYLYDDGEEAKYGDVNDTRAQWERVDIDGYVAFKNRETGDFLSIERERDYAEAAGGDASFWSAQWALEDYDGYQRLRNRWRGDRYLDTERQLGYAQATAGLFAGSYSTHWELEAVTP